MSKNNKILYFFISTVFFIIFDIYFSELILSTLRYKTPKNPLFDIIFVQNTGAAFSILENSQLLLIIFSILALVILFSYVLRNVEKFSTISCFWAAMLVAGIFCNLYERFYYGYVRDFFKLNFIEFPVFNISDMFINIAVLAIIVIIIKNKYLRK